MQSNVGKWGNSLAVRLPADVVRASGLRDGVAVEVSVTSTGEVHVLPASGFDKTAFLRHVDALHRNKPISAPVIDELRKVARY